MAFENILRAETIGQLLASTVQIIKAGDIGISPTGILNDVIPFNGSTFHIFDEDAKDGWDLTVIRLADKIGEELRLKGKTFVRHNQIDLEEADTKGIYIVCGFPTCWNSELLAEDRLATRPVVYQTYLDSSPPNKIANYDPKIHLLLNYDPKIRHHGPELPKDLPDLKGISGCGIWQVGSTKKGIPFAKSDGKITLVGIEHCVVDLAKRIKGTKISHAMHIISEEYPDTTDAMKLIYFKN